MKRFLWTLAILTVLLISLATSSAQDDALPWWNDRVFYEIFVRSFYDSDGDGVGDIRGIIEKLDYLNDGDPTTVTDLGITGIWLMPINPSPSYHGYDVTDYRDINPAYGTMDDFRELVAAAHERGIAIVIDFVINHTSDEHPWFIASANGDPEYADWYIWRDDNPGYRGPWGEQVWHRYGDRYYYGIFTGFQPDLNFENPEVTAAIYDIASFWLTDVGIDGFRVDAAKHIIEDGQLQENTPQTRAWLADFNAYLDSVRPQTLTIAEVFRAPSFIGAEYVRAGAADLVFAFDVSDGIISSVSQNRAQDIVRKLQAALEDYPNSQFATFISNHDAVWKRRPMSIFVGNVDKAKLAATLLLTSPGVPFIYYGEEIGMFGTEPDERVRTPMYWDDTPTTAGFTTASRPWIALSETTGSVASMTDDPTSLLSHYRRLVHMRNEHLALRRGDMLFLESESRNVYAAIRYYEDDVIFLLINFSGRTVDDYALSLAGSPFSEVQSTTQLLGDEVNIALPEFDEQGGFSGYLPIPELPPRAAYIFQFNMP